jgi:hypothetical protein
LGRMTSICFERWVTPCLICCFDGVPRLGKHLTGLVMNTSFSFRPIDMIAALKNFPDRPINGRPIFASSFPGASPTNMTFADGLPSPGTVNPTHPRGQMRQRAISHAICSSFLDLSIRHSVCFHDPFKSRQCLPVELDIFQKHLQGSNPNQSTFD